MMSHLQRLQARMLLGTQAEAISWMLDQGDHGLTPQKEQNWKKLLECLRETSLCFHDMEEDMTRTRNELSGYRIRALEDAERIGRMEIKQEMLDQEIGRLKDSLHEALMLLESNNIKTHKLWRT